MSAPRVPAGWTQEAADLVWLDWESALMSMSPPSQVWVPIPPVLPEGATWLEAGVFLLNDWPRIELRWLRPEARLRAWAAVGAPVLTPEASRILDAARALPVALEGSEAVDPWMGLAHVVSAVRAEAAAVGAPVLAPAEDGRPSLAEWVAACEGSALGRPTRSSASMTVLLGWPGVCWVYLDNGSMTDWRAHIVDKPRGRTLHAEVATPAELRALLDTLARPA